MFKKIIVTYSLVFTAITLLRDISKNRRLRIFEEWKRLSCFCNFDNYDSFSP